MVKRKAAVRASQRIAKTGKGKDSGSPKTPGWKSAKADMFKVPLDTPQTKKKTRRQTMFNKGAAADASPVSARLRRSIYVKRLQNTPPTNKKRGRPVTRTRKLTVSESLDEQPGSKAGQSSSSVSIHFSESSFSTTSDQADGMKVKTKSKIPQSKSRARLSADKEISFNPKYSKSMTQSDKSDGLSSFFHSIDSDGSVEISYAKSEQVLGERDRSKSRERSKSPNRGIRTPADKVADWQRRQYEEEERVLAEAEDEVERLDAAVQASFSTPKFSPNYTTRSTRKRSMRIRSDQDLLATRLTPKKAVKILGKSSPSKRKIKRVKTPGRHGRHQTEEYVESYTEEYDSGAEENDRERTRKRRSKEHMYERSPKKVRRHSIGESNVVSNSLNNWLQTWCSIL